MSSYIISWLPYIALLIIGLIIINRKEKEQHIRLRDINASILNMLSEQIPLDPSLSPHMDIAINSESLVRYKDCTNFIMSDVAGEFAKGYDCFIVKHADIDTVIDYHKHNKSSELFLVLSGQLAIRLKGGKLAHILGPMMSLYVPRQLEHSIQALVPNTTYLVIAKPPVITFFRGGDLREKLFKCFRNGK